MGQNFLSRSNVTASKSELKQTNFTASPSDMKSQERGWKGRLWRKRESEKRSESLRVIAGQTP